MNKFIIFFIVLLLIIGGVIVYLYATQAPKTAKVTINEQTFDAEIASTSAELQKGLSGRDSLAEDKAMLFMFAEKGTQAFWMREMKFPIDIIFINDNKIVSIAENAPPPKEGQEVQSLPRYTPAGPANRVLEINAGLSSAHGFKPGDEVTIELPGATEEK